MSISPCPWPVASVLDKIEFHRAAATQALGAVLPGLMAVLGVRSAIEIGICNGFTSQLLAFGLAELNPPGVGILLGCDINAQCCQISRDVTQDLSIKHKVVCCDSKTVDWPLLLKEFGLTEVDLAFVDGLHTDPEARHDILACAPLISDHGLLVLHDAAPGYPNICRCIEELMASGQWNRLVIPERAGGIYAGVIMQRRRSGANDWHRLEKPVCLA